MTLPVSFQCEPSDGWCECGACELPPVRDIDLDALASFNRATTGFALSLILVAFIAAIFAAGLIREENRLARQAVIDQERNVSWK